VHAVGAREPGDVGSIVDDDASPCLVRHRDDALGEREQRPARFVFIANLQQLRAAANAGLGQRDGIDAAVAAQRGVDDGVNDAVSPG
jgi:hypothetical protein